MAPSTREPEPTHPRTHEPEPEHPCTREPNLSTRASENPRTLLAILLQHFLDPLQRNLDLHAGAGLKAQRNS